MLAEFVEVVDSLAGATAVSTESEPEPEIGGAVRAREQPAVSGKAPSRHLVPERDDRALDRLIDVGTVGEAPQDGGGVDEAGGRGDNAVRAVGPDDDIADQTSAVVEFDDVAMDGGHAGCHRFGAGFDRSRPKPLIETKTGNGQAMAGIGTSLSGGKHHSAAGRSDDHHWADLSTFGCGQSERGQQCERPWADEISACLVPCECCLVDERHACAAPGEYECGGAATRTGTDDHRVNIGCSHATPWERNYSTAVRPVEGRLMDIADRPDSPKTFTRSLFAGLPERYDRLAAVLSLGQDGRWRREMIDHIVPVDPEKVLDVATGPAGVALQLADRTRAQITGIDLSEDMLQRGQRNVHVAGLGDRVHFALGQGEHLPFPDATFDALTFTYLLRYVADPAATIAELARVVRPGGAVASLEFAVPPRIWWRLAWWFYTRAVLPVGGAVLGGRAWFDVGRFLGPSITGHYRRFSVDDTVAAWKAAGLTGVELRRMSLGGGIVMWARKNDVSPERLTT